MKVFKLWTQMTESLNQTQAAAFWQDYLQTEEVIYDQLLQKKDPHVQGKLADLAKEFNVEPTIFAGFLDGINESIDPVLELEELEDTTELDFTIDYEKLYYNMQEAKAKWLYDLPIWEELLTQEQRNAQRKKFLDAHTRRVEKVGRNEPCPCGSGKKYKHCCLNKE